MKLNTRSSKTAQANNELNNKILNNINKAEEKGICIESIEVSRLYSGDKYQRAISHQKVSNIVKNYDPQKLGTIKVSYRDGKYHVYDGQHRVAACLIVKGKLNRNIYLNCEVHTGLTYEEEARLFAEQYDNSTRIATADRYRALLEAGDKNMIEIKKIVENYGCNISFNGTKGNKDITCLDRIYKLYEKDGKEMLEKVLNVLNSAWDCRYDAMRATMVSGLSIVLNEHGDKLDFDLLKKKLKREDPGKLITQSETLVGYGCNTPSKKVAAMILEVYNKRLKEDKRLYMRK